MAEKVRWLRFQDGGQSYAVEADRVRSVEGCERLQLNPRPEGPLGWLLGIEGDLPVAALARAGQATRGQLAAWPPADKVESKVDSKGEQAVPRPILARGSGGGGRAVSEPIMSRPRRPGPASGQVIVLETASGTAGLWADAVTGREEVPVSLLRRLPPVAESRLFSRMARSAGRTSDIVLEVSPEAIAEQVAAGDFRLAPASASGGGFAREAGCGSATEPISPASAPGPGGELPAAAPETRRGRPVSAPTFDLPQAHGEGERRLLLFSTGRPRGLPFGLNARQALEMLRPRQVRPLPGAPPYLLGLVSWRGEPIAALDLDVRLGLARDSTTVRRLLVVRSRDQEEVAALVVDRMAAILQQPFRFRQAPPPPAMRADLLRGVFEEAGQPFLLPDIDRMLRLPPAAGEPAEAPGNAPSYWA